MKPMTVILIGAIFVIIGGIIGAIGTFKQNKSSSEKSSRIEKGVDKGLEIGNITKSSVSQLQKQNKTLFTKVENQSKIIDNLRKENTDLYSKLSQSSLDIYNNLTSANSFCTMEVSGMGKDGDIGYLEFFVTGKNPLNRISATVFDLNVFDAKKNITMQELKSHSIDIGTLDAGKGFVLPTPIKLDKKLGMSFNINFEASNGSTQECYRMRFVNNKWVYAIKVRTILDNKILFSKIDSEYPIKDKKLIFY